MNNSLNTALQQLEIEQTLLAGQLLTLKSTIRENGGSLTEQSQLSRLKEKEWRLQQAKNRAEAGIYGLCKGCGGDINPQRLEALPDAEHCIECIQKQVHSRFKTVRDA